MEGEGERTKDREREREIEKSNLITDFFRAIDTILFLVLNFEFILDYVCKREKSGGEGRMKGKGHSTLD